MFVLCQTLVRYSDTIMTDKMIKERLKTIAKDLSFVDEDAKQCLRFYREATEERDELIRDMYAKEYAPVATSAATCFSRDVYTRLNTYDSYISGYEEYIENTINEYRAKIKRKDEARRLVVLILSLPSVCNRVIYFAYLKNMPVEELCKDLYMSKSTYYRYRNTAIKLLAKQFVVDDE